MGPERGHQFRHDRLHDRIEIVAGEVIDAQLERTQPLRDQLGTASEGEDQRPHQTAKVRKEVAQARGHRQGKLNVEIPLGRLPRGVQQGREHVEDHLEQRKDLLVQVLEPASADAPEQGPKQQEVVHRLFGPGGELDRAGDDGCHVRQQDRLVLRREQRHGHEAELEQPEEDRGALRVGAADVLETAHEEL